MRHTILMLSFAVTACATNGSGDGSLAVDTTSRGQILAGASCVVKTDAASWTVITPAIIAGVMPTSDLRVVCDKPGYRTSELIYKPDARTGGSLGIGVGSGGRHTGVGFGFNMPIATGNGGYPARVTVDMNPQ
jgi:hypothetical protein